EAGYYYFTDHPDDYVGWLGARSLPKLDHSSPTLRERMYGADDSVLLSRLGGSDHLTEDERLDGWRIDVANMTGRLGAQDVNHEVSGLIATRMREIAPEAWLLAEHFYDAGPDTRHDGWHGVMNYAGFTRPVWAWLNTGPEGVRYAATHTSAPLPSSGAAEAVRAMRTTNAGLPWRVRTHSVNALSTHDSRVFARWWPTRCSTPLAWPHKPRFRGCRSSSPATRSAWRAGTARTPAARCPGTAPRTGTMTSWTPTVVCSACTGACPHSGPVGCAGWTRAGTT